MAFINLDKVSVEFPIYNVSARSFKNQILRIGTGGKFGADSRSKVIVKALENISLHIEHGDRVGLVGHNGAGKSTLLRVIAQIYEPTSGDIEVSGSISPLLEMMMGMDPESTGYENIIMRGLILGLTHKQIREKVEEIAEFSELGDYLSVPVRTYSSGMKVRLAFAIVTSVKPDILILDEILGAGDAEFMKKARRRIDDLIEHSSIVIVASHNQDILEKFCNKIIHLETGRVKYYGALTPQSLPC